jgi:hypothetical protein
LPASRIKDNKILNVLPNISKLILSSISYDKFKELLLKWAEKTELKAPVANSEDMQSPTKYKIYLNRDV